MKTALKIAVLILAAGEASRMQHPKQLLAWKETTLLNHSITTVSNLRNARCFVVLGAHKDVILPTITHPSVSVLYNENWKQGMGASISVGVKNIRSQAAFDALLILLADQPLVHTTYLQQLIDTFITSKKGIVASQYTKTTLGVPAIFDAKYFKQLEALKDDIGAKYIIKTNSVDAHSIEASGIIGDIDTSEVYTNLYKKYH